MSRLTDMQAMQLALAQAEQSALAGEVPVGAVVVKDGVVIAASHNAPIGNHDPTAHAEIRALRAAAQTLGNYRLDDCELFVTLEPCPMCAGAMLHARLKRVVFGALEPKTGAAGSVLNLFSDTQLNHQTQLEGGLLAPDCARVLQSFFQKKRVCARQSASPLRDDALRTPEARFSSLPNAAAGQAQFISDLSHLQGLRMHYLDVGDKNAPITYLCLHGFDTWSHAFHQLIPKLIDQGHRVIAPDLIGFGKSDKPKKAAVHTLAWHLAVLQEWLARLDLKPAVLVLQEGHEALGRAWLATLPSTQRVALDICNSAMLGEMTPDALQAPFSDSGHAAALRAFAPLITPCVPTRPDPSSS
jgi:tRNA(adenine34) deaminase